MGRKPHPQPDTPVPDESRLFSKQHEAEWKHVLSIAAEYHMLPEDGSIAGAIGLFRLAQRMHDLAYDDTEKVNDDVRFGLRKMAEAFALFGLASSYSLDPGIANSLMAIAYERERGIA